MHSHKISLAPMVDRTDRHFRYLLNLLTQKTLLYSEMHSTGAILNGNIKEILKQNPKESNCVLQIATDSPEDAYQAIKKVDNLFNYCEYNLNVGCPSERVQKACYGASLMKYPHLVKEILCAMREASPKESSAKIRIGIKNKPDSLNPPENLTSWENLVNFIETIKESKINTIIVHSRIAILEGFSPKENRQIPPLKRDWVYKLKELFPDLSFILNGGIKTLEEIQEVISSSLQGVMIGRASYDNPYLIAKASRLFLEEKEPIPTRREILKKMEDYIKEEEELGVNVRLIYPHLMGLFHEEEGARLFRQILSPPFNHNEKISLRFNQIWEKISPHILDKPIFFN